MAEQVVQLFQRLLRLVGRTERTVQADAGTDALFAGGSQLQTLFTQACRPGQANAALGRGFLQGLLPVVVEVAAQRMVGP
ncbi:hypothetical protein D3C79_1004760 [compost metagenome]